MLTAWFMGALCTLLSNMLVHAHIEKKNALANFLLVLFSSLVFWPFELPLIWWMHFTGRAAAAKTEDELYKNMLKED
jgi:hypothetical protein